MILLNIGCYTSQNFIVISQREYPGLYKFFGLNDRKFHGDAAQWKIGLSGD